MALSVLSLRAARADPVVRFSPLLEDSACHPFPSALGTAAVRDRKRPPIAPSFRLTTAGM
ncbi:MAG: hypothetical protein K2X87_16975 [Gemmataceae bacterium]|nr:hypothetical protein [Gemmataceae bacterium]